MPIGTNPPATGRTPGYGQGNNNGRSNPFIAPALPALPTPGSNAGGTRATPNPYQSVLPNDLDPYNGGQWGRDNYERLAAYENLRMQQAQLSQNNYQYGQDFNEDQRRFNQQFAQQQANDRFSQDLAGRQFELSGWQARESANQFNRQLGFEQQRNQQQYGLQNRQFSEGQRQFNQSFGLQQQQFGEGQRQFNQSFGLQQQQFGEQQRQFNQQYGLQQQQFGEQQRQFNQQYGLQQQQFGEGQRQFNVGQQNQMQMARENRASQELQARYSAFGRAQAPGGGRVMRSW